MDVLSSFGVDWKLLIASIINFVILLFILNKIIYKPVLDVLDKRKKTIDESLENAAQIEKKLQETTESERQILHKARLEAQNMLKTAEEQAVTRQQEILDQAHEHAKKLIAETKIELEQQNEKMKREIESQLADLVVAATKAVLQDKTPAGVDKQFAETAIKSVKKA